ncbi:MAG: metallophosphoesterase family protein [Acidimicrobiales bacterium]
MKPLRLLHTSDVHFGGGFRAPEHGDHFDDCLCPLGAIERSVAVEQPDVMLVVGDLFDHQRVDDQLVKTVLDRLGNLGVPCVMIAGNHDVHDEGSVYNRGAATGVVDGSDLIFLDDHAGTTVELLDGALALWGKAMPMHDRTFRPLQDVPARPRDDAWWVVLGHGHYETEDLGLMGRSSPLTPADIEATAADYVALGHWHVRTDVSTENVPAWYSGAPYGLAASEMFNVIELHPQDGVTVRSVDAGLHPEGCA